MIFKWPPVKLLKSAEFGKFWKFSANLVLSKYGRVKLHYLSFTVNNWLRKSDKLLMMKKRWTRWKTTLPFRSKSFSFYSHKSYSTLLTWKVIYTTEVYRTNHKFIISCKTRRIPGNFCVAGAVEFPKQRAKILGLNLFSIFSLSLLETFFLQKKNRL